MGQNENRARTDIIKGTGTGTDKLKGTGIRTGMDNINRTGTGT